jgi:hypothetical protein
LFKNLGELRFTDASREAGLPAGIPAFGVAAQDVTGDGWPDFFLAAPGNGNRLFINDRNGKFHEPAGSRETFAWPTAGGDNMVCGVCFGDVNGDGLPDVVIGQHFQHPWREPVANRLYVHQGTTDNVPTFKDVTEQSGLVPLPMKAPHVEIQDFNNDGTLDISTTIVKVADSIPHPIIFQGVGSTEGMPRFSVSGLDVNDFPTAADSAIEGSKAFFDKMIADGKVLYTAAGPVADYDNDGRLDMFLASWWLELPSLLLRNESPSGHWLRVRVEGPPGVNRMGIGAMVRVYRAGGLDMNAEPIGSHEIAAGYGYASGQPAEAHFGLGKTERVDVEVILPHARGKILRRDVSADQVQLMRQ